jgi:hypothetical protein
VHCNFDQQHFAHISILIDLLSTCAALKSLKYVFTVGPIVSRLRWFVHWGVRAPSSIIRILEKTRRVLIGKGVDVRLMLELGLDGLDTEKYGLV